VRACRAVNCNASNPLLTRNFLTVSPNFPCTTKEDKRIHVIHAFACACPYVAFHVHPLAKGVEASLL